MVPHEIEGTIEHDAEHRLHAAHVQHPGQGSDGPPAILPSRSLINPQEMMAVCSMLCHYYTPEYNINGDCSLTPHFSL